MNLSHDPIVWAAAICTLGIYTILYRENRAYRFFEHLFVGVATGYGVMVVYRDIILPRWWGAMVEDGRWWWVLALPAGSLYYLIYSRKYVWMSRLVISTMFGLGAGLAFKLFANDQIPQVYAALRPLWLKAGSEVSGVLVERSGFEFSAVVAAVTLFCVLAYFFFSFRREKVPGMERMATWGRWLMMIAFGAIFGSTVMARMSLLVARLQFLLERWLGV